MNQRENLLALLQRKPYDHVPVEFMLCPSLEQLYHEKTGCDDPYQSFFQMPWQRVSWIEPQVGAEQFLKYYPDGLKPGAVIDIYGVAHEPGSEAAKHMTYMRNPLKNAESIEDLVAYPYPMLDGYNNERQKQDVQRLHAQGLASLGNMQCTVWETAWYMRGMENLMVDMMSDDPIAVYLLDKITEISIQRACLYVDAGVDILFLGDDIGMQRSIMMSESLYCDWIKPRQKQLIDAVRRINPNVIVFYHSCGLITPFIPHLIEIGVDVLNPIQPECMDFRTIYENYGDKLCFHGTIGTQQLMPFGTPDEVRGEVFRNLDIAKKHGGLFVAPTHLLEPEVPWENIIAYVNACHDYMT